MTCGGHGKCIEDKKTHQFQCKCRPPYTGKDCKDVMCKKNCGHGKCINFKCVCDAGWLGKKCDRHGECLHNCSGKGKCVGEKGTGKPICKCKKGYMGADCSSDGCTKDSCNGRGSCKFGKCKCKEGWHGRDCELEDCPNQCSKHGECNSPVNHGTFKKSVPIGCICDPLWTGEGCEFQVCNDFTFCNGHGSCRIENGNPTCKCRKPFVGKACTHVECNKKCGHGYCMDFKCHCKEGWSGEKCDYQGECYNKCSGNGKCVGKKGKPVCKCKKGFTGKDCSDKVCTKSCSGRGECLNNKCRCKPGFQGKNCELESCPSACSNRGKCMSREAKNPKLIVKTQQE